MSVEELKRYIKKHAFPQFYGRHGKNVITVVHLSDVLAEINRFFKDKRHKVVCLVGSSSPEWQERYRQVERELSLAGYVVLSVSLFKTDVDDIEKYRDLLESIHFQKIDMADITVLIHENAIGTHTAMEIEYCHKVGKPVVVFSEINQTKGEIETCLKRAQKELGI